VQYKGKGNFFIFFAESRNSNRQVGIDRRKETADTAIDVAFTRKDCC
jgi:hypothetical protein